MRTDRGPVEAAAEYLGERLETRPSVALILGSGLGALAGAVEEAVAVPYAEIPGFATTTVEGHAGRLVAGRLEGVNVIVFQGRYHAYEGHDPRDLATPVRTAAALGAGTLIVTCAAGGVTRRLGAGTLMCITDHINLMGRNPLVGQARAGEPRFPDMTDAYDPALRERAGAAADELGIELAEGVYAAMLGPSYETPAEITMLERLGADAVGMSTVPEVIAARAAGLRVLGIALITNAAAGVVEGPLDHDEVIAAGAEAADDFQRLVRGTLARL
ncbi:MAG: purine-nucleoside phosphorylase [Longimicrobiales bacterium]|nr:purine-nucleoside phosphorylase [Longimicrobiales bacterium]